MKRFNSGMIPGHTVARGAQPDDDGELCLYQEHLEAVQEQHQFNVNCIESFGRVFAKTVDEVALVHRIARNVADANPGSDEVQTARDAVRAFAKWHNIERRLSWLSSTEALAEQWLEEHHETT